MTAGLPPELAALVAGLPQDLMPSPEKQLAAAAEKDAGGEVMVITQGQLVLFYQQHDPGHIGQVNTPFIFVWL